LVGTVTLHTTVGVAALLLSQTFHKSGKQGAQIQNAVPARFVTLSNQHCFRHADDANEARARHQSIFGARHTDGNEDDLRITPAARKPGPKRRIPKFL